jgi:hypothetical protein
MEECFVKLVGLFVLVVYVDCESEVRVDDGVQMQRRRVII